jgi:hypothetical protein
LNASEGKHSVELTADHLVDELPRPSGEWSDDDYD